VTRENAAINVEQGGIPDSATDVGNSPSEQAPAAPGVRQRRRGSRKDDMAVPEAVGSVRQSAKAITGLLTTGMGEDLLAIMCAILERNSLSERLAHSPDEAAELLGISTELVHDLLRTGQLGSVKAGRRRLIAKQHLAAFLAGER
jgi:excisionase family DNA binding protein